MTLTYEDAWARRADAEYDARAAQADLEQLIQDIDNGRRAYDAAAIHEAQAAAEAAGVKLADAQAAQEAAWQSVVAS